jgi:hypothetical protein
VSQAREELVREVREGRAEARDKAEQLAAMVRAVENKVSYS